MEKEEQHLPQRRSIRLKDCDYSQPGAYFVTICLDDHRCLFGNVVDYKMMLNEFGILVGNSWEWLSTQYSYVSLDEWIVMPNHLHGIILINAVEGGGSPILEGTGGSRTAPTSVAKTKSLGSLIGAFKTVSTKRINERRQTPGVTIWQRNYYEHIIRGERDMAQIRDYIANNPAKWAEDKYNPHMVKPS